MKAHAPSLAGQFGTMRMSAQADAAPGWLPAPLHALIMSCLARIFGRLERMLLLWQSGALPLPQPSAPRPAHHRAPSLYLAGRRTGTRSARHDASTPGIPPRAAATQHHTAATHLPAETIPSRARAVRLKPPH